MSASIFLVAGEPSGDIYGADLVAELRRMRPDIALFAAGGPRMAAAGASCLLDSSEWGVIGWVNVLPRLPAFFIRLARVRREIARRGPAAVVLIDFSGFNLTLAARLQGKVPTAYFIPPMVTTRRGDRARRIASLGLRLLAVLPFEADAFRAAGADVVFVGHPAVDRVRPSAPAAEIRQRLGLPPGAPLLALLPGSRRQELRRHLSIMLAALPAVRARFPAVRGVLPVASARWRPAVEAAARAVAVPITLVEGGSQAGYDAMAAADFAVIASGTATLEALCLGVPAVVIYKAAPVDFWVARRMMAFPWVALPSLLAGRAVVPELLQNDLTPGRLGAVVIEWMADAPRLARQRRELLVLRERLGGPGAAPRAAREVLRLARLLGSEGSSTIQTT